MIDISDPEEKRRLRHLKRSVTFMLPQLFGEPANQLVEYLKEIADPLRYEIAAVAITKGASLEQIEALVRSSLPPLGDETVAMGIASTLESVALQLLPLQFGPAGQQLVAHLQSLSDPLRLQIATEATLEGATFAQVEDVVTTPAAPPPPVSPDPPELQATEGWKRGRATALSRVARALLPLRFGAAGKPLLHQLAAHPDPSKAELVAEALLQGADLAHIQTLIG